MPSVDDDEPPPSGESPSPAASSPLRAAALRADLPMSPGRAAAAAIMRGISGMIGASISPICASPPTHQVGASPFHQSLVESTISTTVHSSTNGDDYEQGQRKTDDVILQMAAEDFAEEGDGSDSDVEGGEVNLHFEAMSLMDRNLETIHALANDLDEDDLGEEFVEDESQIPGAPQGWVPPGAPIGYQGYFPKSNSPLFFSEVDNPGGWSDFCFQAKYAPKGKEYMVLHQRRPTQKPSYHLNQLVQLTFLG